MAAQAGSAVIVSIKDDAASPAYVVVAGLRSREIALNNESVDVTNANSTGLWRELLAAGVRSCSISGSGVFTDVNGDAEVKDAFFEKEVRDMTFLVPDFGTFEGSFLITNLTYGAEYNQDVTFSATFESAGAVSFTAV